MLRAHGGEITADEIGELALLSLPVVLLLVMFALLADRARNASRGVEEQVRGPEPSNTVNRPPARTE